MKLIGPMIATFVTLGFSPARADAPKVSPKPIDPCGPEALKLGTSRPLVAWKPPVGCKARGSTIALRTKGALDAEFNCPTGIAVEVDLAKYVLVQVTQTMPPAAIGLEALDDGRALTLVTRFRTACPKDPQTKPTTKTAWFLVPLNGDRTVDRASCTIEMKCQ